MKKILFYIVIQFFSISLLAQRLHMPDEVIRLMEKSKITYVFDTLQTLKFESITFPNIGQKTKRLYRIDTENEIRLDEEKNIKYNKKELKYLKKGNKLVKKKKIEKARKFYLMAYDLQPSDIRISNKIGQTYFDLKEYDTAIHWFQKSINFNFIDTEARIQLAESYIAINEHQKAVKEITLAHIFNRNDDDIIHQLRNIYAQSEYKYFEISFHPRFELFQTANKDINILYGHSIWAAYAAVKALWLYEPNYATEMNKISNQSHQMIMEKEAVLNALITYDNLEEKDKEKKFPLLHLLSDISLKGQIDNFILYEIISKEDPLSLLLLSKEKIEALSQYIIQYRSGLKL